MQWRRYRESFLSLVAPVCKGRVAFLYLPKQLTSVSQIGNYVSLMLLFVVAIYASDMSRMLKDGSQGSTNVNLHKYRIQIGRLKGLYAGACPRQKKAALAIHA